MKNEPILGYQMTNQVSQGDGVSFSCCKKKSIRLFVWSHLEGYGSPQHATLLYRHHCVYVGTLIEITGLSSEWTLGQLTIHEWVDKDHGPEL